jgi:hypothetical protein
VFIGVIVAFLVLSCANPLSTPSSSPTTDSKHGSITIKVQNNIGAKTLVPPISMTAASYTVHGSGPAGSGATFDKPITNGTLTVTGLVPGAWFVTVTAWNGANGTGQQIGNGVASVTVYPGQSAATAVNVAPLSGNGILNVGINWAQYPQPVASIQASLISNFTAEIPTTTPLSFTVNPSTDTANVLVSSLPVGYYVLNWTMLDASAKPLMGGSDIVRIVSGQTTSGTYNYVATSTNFTVYVSVALNNPIVLSSISGIPATITPATDIKATVSTSDGTTGAMFGWSLNGQFFDPKAGNQTTNSSGTSGTIDLGTLAPGYYRLDAMAVTSDGSRAGSQTATFVVLPNPPFISAELFVQPDGTSFREMVMVATDNTGNTPILGAVVTATVGTNSPVAFTWDGPSNAYLGNVTIPAGAKFTLSVTPNGNWGGPYTATATQYTTFPSLISPAPAGAIWTVINSNTLKWNAGAPTAGSYYIAGIADATISNWFYGDPGGGPWEVTPIPSSPITLTVPASKLSAGTYTAMVGIMNG